MEALESSLAEGACSSLLEGGRRNIYTKGTEFQDGQPVVKNLIAQRRGKNILRLSYKRLTSFLTGNSYIDTSVQKGGVPGFSGCVEHTSAISQLIHEAKKERKDHTVVWLD